ncbi:MAG: hypothetical protein WBH40_12855 [Ignavibacteriaceae bacterium]|jgi:hypothetical protein
MKFLHIIALIIFSSSFIQSHEIGIDFNIGYTNLNMEQVNQYLNNSESVDLESLLIIPNQWNPIGASLIYELGVSAKLSQFVVRLSGNYLSTNGSWESRDTIKYINHDIDVSTVEILASAGYNIPIYKTASILLEGGIGYGFASSEITYITRSYRFHNELENIKHNVSSGYLAGRLRGGFEAKLKWLMLRIVIGYRFANSVVLTCDSIINGEKKENQPVIDNNGNELVFDFSGIYYAWGITVLL